MKIRVNQRNINTDRVLLFNYNFGLLTYIMNNSLGNKSKNLSVTIPVAKRLVHCNQTNLKAWRPSAMWKKESQALRHCQMSLDQGADRFRVIQIDLLVLSSCTLFPWCMLKL